MAEEMSPQAVADLIDESRLVRFECGEGRCSYGLGWKRELTPEEHAAIGRNPFTLFVGFLVAQDRMIRKIGVQLEDESCES